MKTMNGRVVKSAPQRKTIAEGTQSANRRGVGAIQQAISVRQIRERARAAGNGLDEVIGKRPVRSDELNISTRQTVG